ncbi:unnamed protein product [Tuber melanosporum]|uniref:(Perigord truffle) hypothetical protein n=1 Tax=Tuber melanosporum (strain Mel28) TaxID=656061 RepID=D5G4V3_TUBMM|nr:uncharacterized protein GSTUM_00000105001 [Tuber melanosporum]CAZ79546.1 unnamed protein product [Tuber melanosporum]
MQSAPISQTHPYTCNACQVAFRNHDQQRTHYHTDWHQYNLKRKVASLPPLSSETFAEKVLTAQASTRLERERASFERTCKACNRTYYSENAYVNHVGSQRHRQNNKEQEKVVSDTEFAGMVQALKVAEAVGNESSGSWTNTACLFCTYVSPSLLLNVSHMTKAHGLFIPERNFLADLEGLIRYLGQKLVLGNQCLYCNKSKGGLEGIRTHMKDKGHTMLGFETESQQIELGQFYDFTSTYSDVSGDEATEEPCKRGLKAPVLIRKEGEPEGEGWEGADDGEGWETDSSASSLDSQDLFYHDDYELHLPSGRSVGHRSLARYYRQNLRDHPLQTREVRRIADTQYPHSDDGTEVRRRNAITRANGGQGMLGVSLSKKREVREQEKRSRDLENRGRRRQEWGVNRKANMQKHYRDPLLQ